jgi:hypothetical protein
VHDDYRNIGKKKNKLYQDGTLFRKDVGVKVLTKLDDVLLNRRNQMLQLIRYMFSTNMNANEAVVKDDVIPQKADTEEKLSELNSIQSTEQDRKKMVNHYFCIMVQRLMFGIKMGMLSFLFVFVFT